MFTSLKILVLFVFSLTANAQKNFGSSCRNVNCASTQQCLGLYETCRGGLVDGSTCGFYATCVDLEGDVKHSAPERTASTSNVGNDAKPTDVILSNKTSSNSDQLYPSLPQPNQPSPPQGGYYPANPQGGYYPANPQGGYYPANPQGGYYPANPQPGYNPPNPQGYPNYPPASDSSGNKKDSDSDSGFGGILNFFSGGNRGSSANSGGPDLGTLLGVLGKGYSGNTNPSSSSGSGGLDFSSLLSTFTGSGGRGSGQNTRNDFDNRNPTGQVGPNPSYGQGNNGQNANQPQDSGPSFLQTLGNFASSPLGQQLLVNALRSRDNNQNEPQQNRRYGGLFSENSSRTTQNEAGTGSKGYPTQAPYSP